MKKLGLGLILFLIFLKGFAEGIQAQRQLSQRHFWLPSYLGQRLDYCDTKHCLCGLKLAHIYCKMMGYEKAKQALIDRDIGSTRFLHQKSGCKGLGCNGFKTIVCVQHASLKPQSYHYRYKRYVFPRYQQSRVAWCYDGKKGCGRQAAHAFCRKLAFLKASSYDVDPEAGNTRAIGNQRLCVGKRCCGFRQIICFR